MKSLKKKAWRKTRRLIRTTVSAISDTYRHSKQWTALHSKYGHPKTSLTASQISRAINVIQKEKKEVEKNLARTAKEFEAQSRPGTSRIDRYNPTLNYQKEQLEKKYNKQLKDLDADLRVFKKIKPSGKVPREIWKKWKNLLDADLNQKITALKQEKAQKPWWLKK